MTQLSAFLVLSAAVLVASPTIASPITWGPATDTMSASDVLTTGSLVKAFDSGGLGATVNGVAFAPAGNSGDDVYNAIGPGTFGQFDDNADLGDLDALLSTAGYAAPPLKIPRRQSFHYQAWCRELSTSFSSSSWISAGVPLALLLGASAAMIGR